MKIYSKFSDYYDTAMAHGVDDHVHWTRNVVKMNWAKNPFSAAGRQHPFLETELYFDSPSSKSINHRWQHDVATEARDLVFDTVYVGVCGKVYPAMRFSWNKDWATQEQYTAYNTDDIVTILENYDKKFKQKVLVEFLKKEDKRRQMFSWQRTGRTQFREEAMDRFFKQYSGSEVLSNYFIEHKVPIFAIVPDDQMMYLNPKLKTYGFQTVMDSYTTYQEIEMFLGGVLGTADGIDVPGVDDKHLAEKKGFDEWSFKTMPTKHK